MMATMILPATDALVAELELWLDAEESAYQQAKMAWVTSRHSGTEPARGFRCNWDTVKKHWRGGFSTLDVIVVDGSALGFLSGTDVLEIHPGHRGLGYGKQLADKMIQRAVADNLSVLEIQIEPKSAERFWVNQGFIPDHADIHHRGGLYAHRKLPRSFQLGSGLRIPIVVEFYDERQITPGGPPFNRYEGEGELLPDGVIQLPCRLHGYDASLQSNVENHIRIAVAGREIYFERAKYGAEHGARRDRNGHHYIDSITTAEGLSGYWQFP